MDEFVMQLDMKVLGRRLQKVRQHIGMKQSEVAVEIGCAPLTISRMERGETSTSLLPLLVYYSQTIDLNLLFGHDFNPDDEAVYGKNASLQELAKRRLVFLKEEVVKQSNEIQEDYKETVETMIEKLFEKLAQKVEASAKKEQEKLLRQLDQTIKML